MEPEESLFAIAMTLTLVFREIAAAPEGYYLLGYMPQNLKTDGHYHSLKVSLTVKTKFAVEARHGFYAPRRTETPAEAVKREIEDAVFSQDEQHGFPVTFQTKYSKRGFRSWKSRRNRGH